MTSQADLISGWIESILSTERPPPEVCAYYFGLFETPDGYAVYLTGSTEYNPSDDDWACNTDFEPRDKILFMPDGGVSSDLTSVLNEMVKILCAFVRTESFKRSFLANAVVIAIGFDGGHLVLIK